MDSTEKVLVFLILMIFLFLMFAALTYAEANIMQRDEYRFYRIADLEVRLPEKCVRSDVYNKDNKLLFQVHTQDKFVVNQIIGIYHKAFEDGIQEGMKQSTKTLKVLLDDHNLKTAK
jgi:hypothetical protein